MGNLIILALIFISIIMIAFLMIHIINLKNKCSLHYSFFLTLIFMFIWDSGNLVEFIMFITSGKSIMEAVNISLLGTTLIPISILLIGISYGYPNLKITRLFVIFSIVPLMSQIIIWTNQYHKLFYINYSIINSKILFGKYFVIHSIYSYLCILVGLVFIFRFTIKNTGLFSKQALFLALGCLIPIIVNIIFTLKIFNLYQIVNPISFSAALIFWFIAIFKYDFLNVVPIARENIINMISYSVLVISNSDKNYRILDKNKTFEKTFEKCSNNYSVGNCFFEALDVENILGLSEFEIKKKLSELKNKDKIILLKEIKFKKENIEKWFHVEISNVDIKRDIGTIILFKDVTEVKNAQKQLTELERLATLGELAGGVAHDINSPLSVVQNSLHMINTIATPILERFENSFNENELKQFKYYPSSLSNANMAVGKIKQIVDSIRNHTRNLSGNMIYEFNLKKTLEDLNILLNYLLKKHKSKLIICESTNTNLIGDPSKLSQVMTNLILNAAEAYGKDGGEIKISSTIKNDFIEICVVDTAGGIPEHIQKGIFKNILTTKGTQGTGLGLYMSNSIITGHFKGTLTYISEKSKGTSFIISVPISKK